MNIDQMLQNSGAVDAIARQLGVDPATAQAGAAALLPSILAGFQNPAAPAAAGEPEAAATAFPAMGGLGGLLGSLGGMGGGGLLDNVTSDGPTEIGKGNEILGQIFGSKDGSRAVAAEAASQSGVEPSLLKKMLPMLAMVAAGYVMKQAGSGNLGGALGGILGGQQPSAGNAQPQAANPNDILGSLIGAAGQFLGR